MSSFPSPAEYAALLAAGQQHLLSQILRNQPSRAPGAGACENRAGVTNGQSTSSPQQPPASSTPLPHTQELVPLQPLLQEWLANAFRIPAIPNAPRPSIPGTPGGPPPFGLLPPPFPGIPPVRTQELANGRSSMPLVPPFIPPSYFLGPGPVPPPVNLMIPGPVGCIPAPFQCPYVPFAGLPPSPENPGFPPVGFYLPNGGGTSASKDQANGRKREADKTFDKQQQHSSGERYPVKRTRLVWTPELHQRFLEAVEQLGANAVPKNIMQVMNVEGLTRSNVASHLQKYRLQMKKEGNCTICVEDDDCNGARLKDTVNLESSDDQIWDAQSCGEKKVALLDPSHTSGGRGDPSQGQGQLDSDQKHMKSVGIAQGENSRIVRCAENSFDSTGCRSEGSARYAGGEAFPLVGPSAPGILPGGSGHNGDYTYTMTLEMQRALLEWSAQMGLTLEQHSVQHDAHDRSTNSQIQSSMAKRIQPGNGSCSLPEKNLADQQESASEISHGKNGKISESPTAGLRDNDSLTIPAVENEC